MLKIRFWAACFLIFAGWGNAFAQPDPRDSVILESKSVAPGFHPGAVSDTGAYFYIRVYITNKDSLTAVTLAAEERSLSEGAYVIAGWPRNFAGTMSRLTATLSGSVIGSFTRYHSNSPDSFVLSGVYDPLDLTTIEPPNLLRKVLWEIKFDSVWKNPGTIEIDTAIIQQPTGFVNTVPQDIPVNFLKAVITVMAKGDLDLNGELSAADVMWGLNCIYLGQPSAPAAYACDLNCDGRRTAADMVWELQAVFLGRAFPC